MKSPHLAGRGGDRPGNPRIRIPASLTTLTRVGYFLESSLTGVVGPLFASRILIR